MLTKTLITSVHGQHEHNHENEGRNTKTTEPGAATGPGPRKTADKKLPDLPATELEAKKKFSESDMAEAEKLFKEEHANLFESAEKAEKVETDCEEISILPLEVEIVDEETKDEKPKKRVKCNSAGQEPPPVPLKPAYLRTISMTSGNQVVQIQNRLFLTTFCLARNFHSC